MSAIDARWMARAIELAGRGGFGTRPNPRVGCVIARDELLVAEGWHERAGGPHAEAMALRAAGAAAAGATAYVSLEPCAHHGRTPPCAEALVAAGVARVVYGLEDPNPAVAGGGVARLQAAGIAVRGPLLAGPAAALNPGFLLRMAEGRPRVIAKVGESADARTALADGRSKWITGAEARADGQRLRAGAGAIITGVGTALADDPALTVRDPRFLPPLPGAIPAQPLRVVLDRALRLAPDAQLTDTTLAPTLVLTEAGDEARMASLRTRGVEVVRMPSVAPAAVLALLAERAINDVLLEAGPTLLEAFLHAERVDELVVYQAPMMLGASARAAFALPEPASLGQARRFTLIESRAIGSDLRLRYTPQR